MKESAYQLLILIIFSMSKKLVTLLTAGLLVMNLAACSNQPAQPYGQADQSQPTPAAPADANDTKKTVVYMVKMEDNGKSANSIQVGCGDSVVPVDSTVGYQYNKTDAVASVNAALTNLFGTTADQFKAQNLQNTLAATNSLLTVKSVEKNGNNLIAHLKGKFSFGGVCDMPRVKAQVEETIKKAALGNTFTIDYNGGGQAAWDKAFSSK